MNVRRYQITLEGVSPLLMHQDSIEWADALAEWRNRPENKKQGKAGDDRSPAWSWLGGLYHDGGRVVIPSDNLMTMLREGGAMVSTGKRNATFKSQTQSGIMVDQFAWPILVDGGQVLTDNILALQEEPDFAKHQSTVVDLGFELFVKRARIGQSKHVRVRPRFDQWETTGTVTVTDDQITEEVLAQILAQAGRYKGLCDWRPSSRTPGPFGTFTAELKEVKP